MKTPAFWDISPPNWQARLLQPFAWIYGAVTARRMARPGRALPIPVICVGNLTAGGAGKTPTVLWLVQRLGQAGIRPVILSRGHGGPLHGPVVVDLAQHGAADVGMSPCCWPGPRPSSSRATGQRGPIWRCSMALAASSWMTGCRTRLSQEA